ncbi:MAG TPA: transporter [Phycisphaerales bacterium]|nr:transporter [Phycisphaerales bacterium]
MRHTFSAALLCSALLAAPVSAQGADQPDEPAPRLTEISPDTSFSLFGFETDPIDEPFDPDRPRFRSSPSTVPFGRFAIEAGATYTFDDENEVETQTIVGPEVMLRAGVFSHVEVRVGWSGFESVEIETAGFNDTTHGTSDMTAGVKVELLESDGLIPAAAVAVSASFPVGSDDFTSDRVDPSAELVLDFDDFNETFGISGSVKVSQFENDTDDTYIQTAASVSLDQYWTEDIETFVEVYSFFNDDDAIDDAHFAQVGAIFKFAPNVTIDARVGAGLTSDSSDLFAGAGGTISF